MDVTRYNRADVVRGEMTLERLMGFRSSRVVRLRSYFFRQRETTSLGVDRENDVT